MNIDPTPDAELASAALDNEVANDEHLRVQADPRLVAEMAIYQGLRTEIAEVPVPSAVRDASLSAAMAVFDQIHLPPVSPTATVSHTATTVSPTATTVSLTDFRSKRQRHFKWLGAVAAAGVFALGGVALFNQRDQDSKASTAAESQLAPSAKVVGGSAPVPNIEASSNTLLAAGDEAPSAASPSTDQAVDAAAPAATDSAAAASQASAGLQQIGGPAEVSAWALAPSLNSEQELIAYVTGANFRATANSVVSADGSASPDTAASAAQPASCFDSQLGAVPVRYLGRDVFAIVDPQPHQVRLIEPTSCAVTVIALP